MCRRSDCSNRRAKPLWARILVAVTEGTSCALWWTLGHIGWETPVTIKPLLRSLDVSARYKCHRANLSPRHRERCATTMWSRRQNSKPRERRRLLPRLEPLSRQAARPRGSTGHPRLGKIPQPPCGDTYRGRRMVMPASRPSTRWARLSRSRSGRILIGGSR